MSSIKAIFFDVGGVLFSSPFPSIGKVEKKWSVPNFFLGICISQGNAFKDFEKGLLTVSEFCQKFDQEVEAFYQKREGQSRSFNGLGTDFVAAIRGGTTQLNKHVFQTAMDLKQKGYIVGVITNNFNMEGMVDSPEFIKFRSCFDFFVESRLEKVRKPDPKIYEIALERANALSKTPLKFEQCIFLDDLGHNLKSAKQLGMNTILVDQKNTEKAVEELLLKLGLSSKL